MVSYIPEKNVRRGRGIEYHQFNGENVFDIVGNEIPLSIGQIVEIVEKEHFNDNKSIVIRKYIRTFDGEYEWDENIHINKFTKLR